MSHKEAFINLLQQFSKELRRMYPNDPYFRFANVTMTMTDDNMICSYFYQYARPFKAEILNKNELFFLHSEDITKKKKISSWTHKMIDTLRQYWTGMDDETKQTTWTYLTVLFKLSEKAYQEQKDLIVPVQYNKK